MERNACRPSNDESTVFILDWDDTVLPTSWLCHLGLTPLTQNLDLESPLAPLRPEYAEQLSDLSEIVLFNLQLVQKRGQVLFVTNSLPGWLLWSCERFMPKLCDILRDFRIMARPPDEQPETFKTSIFECECKRFRHIVSIGDGEPERQAASLLLKRARTPRLGPSTMEGGPVPAETCCVKSVKFIDRPTCQELIRQHKVLERQLTDIIAADHNLDLFMRFTPEFVDGAHDSGCLLDPVPQTWGLSGSPTPVAEASSVPEDARHAPSSMRRAQVSFAVGIFFLFFLFRGAFAGISSSLAGRTRRRTFDRPVDNVRNVRRRVASSDEPEATTDQSL